MSSAGNVTTIFLLASVKPADCVQVAACQTLRALRVESMILARLDRGAAGKVIWAQILWWLGRTGVIRRIS